MGFVGKLKAVTFWHCEITFANELMSVITTVTSKYNAQLLHACRVHGMKPSCTFKIPQIQIPPDPKHWQKSLLSRGKEAYRTPSVCTALPQESLIQRITKSEGSERPPEISSPTLLLKQQVAQERNLAGFDCFQEGRGHSLYKQLFPVLWNSPQSKGVCPHVQMELSAFHFAPTAPCSIFGHWLHTTAYVVQPVQALQASPRECLPF